MHTYFLCMYNTHALSWPWYDCCSHVASLRGSLPGDHPNLIITDIAYSPHRSVYIIIISDPTHNSDTLSNLVGLAKVCVLPWRAPHQLMEWLSNSVTSLVGDQSQLICAESLILVCIYNNYVVKTEWVEMCEITFNNWLTSYYSIMHQYLKP